MNEVEPWGQVLPFVAEWGQALPFAPSQRNVPAWPVLVIDEDRLEPVAASGDVIDGA